ncbi:DUF2061 domain-containing protein, partial [Marinovum sp. 2_MG-2023]|uniref:DUF2061 domain-containing protein n=1 Tax=unclassified Marinovum TaxID=2647166 RepID=UPI0026E242D6
GSRIPRFNLQTLIMNEGPAGGRSALNAITWQITGFGLMSLVGWFFPGSLTAGGGIAFVGTLIGFVSYFVHDLCWSRVSWSRHQN